jgi:hypothetical protein
VVEPSPAPRRDLVEAAPQLLAAGGRAELLTPGTELFPMRVLTPLQIAVADHFRIVGHGRSSSKSLATQYSTSLGY